MKEAFERYYEVESDPLDITGRELANLLDAGLEPTEIDRLRFTRWRVRTNQLEGDGVPLRAPEGHQQPLHPVRWTDHSKSH